MELHKVNRPLEERVFRIKKPTIEFYCPLCRTERAFKSQPRLSRKNFIQISFLTAILVIAAFPWMGVKSFPTFFLFWAGFELMQRFRFRKEIPCPHCGFDASWYHRDVRVARSKVKEFWDKKNSVQTTQSETPLNPDDENEEDVSSPAKTEETEEGSLSL